MNDFKVGDRVEYVGDNLKIKQLGALTVTNVNDGGTVEVNDQGWTAIYYPNLRHVTPPPDILTIPRAELPEVVESGNLFGEAGGSKFDMVNATEGWWRNRALEALAIAEFLAAREKAEQDAADQHAAILNKRRDELAKEFSKEAARFDVLQAVAQAAIDRIIQLEGEAKK